PIWHLKISASLHRDLKHEIRPSLGISLCNLCVLCVSVAKTNLRYNSQKDTECTETGYGPLKSIQDTSVLSANSSLSSTAICASTIPLKFNSPHRLKAKCFARFASAFGCVAFSNVDMRTRSAADFVPASSPTRQIISANAAILSWSVLDVFKWPAESTTVSPASARRTRSASHGSFVSRA